MGAVNRCRQSTGRGKSGYAVGASRAAYGMAGRVAAQKPSVGKGGRDAVEGFLPMALADRGALTLVDQVDARGVALGK